MNRITCTAAALVTALATTAPAIEEFSPQSVESNDWRIVNDGVMGGLSKGRFDVSPDGILTFKGTLSLENNGGFSSIRSGKIDHDLSGHKGIKLRARGDGRTYQMRFTTDARWNGRSIDFKAEFTAPKGEWSEVFIPYSDFTGSFRGRELPDETFDPAKIRRLGLLIADKQAGPFNLEVDWIRAANG